MKNVLNKYFTLSILFCVMFVLLSCSRKVSESKLSKIKVGVTREQVTQVLGKPIEVNRHEFRGQLKEVWTYSNDPASSTNQKVIFDKNKGIVIKVVHMEK